MTSTPTPWRKLEMQSPVDQKWIDITSQIAPIITFEEGNMGLDELNFTISRGALPWVAHMSDGLGVRLEVGLQGQRQFNKRKMFEGVTATSVEFGVGSNGQLQIPVVAQTKLYELQVNQVGSVTYPGYKNNRDLHNREFQFKEKIKISEIIRGIFAEYNLPIGQITIESKHDYEFTHTNPITQPATETDYQFVVRLLTGKTERGVTFGRKKKQHVVNARCRIFWEVDPLTDTAKIHVAPDSKLLKDRGLHTLVPSLSEASELDFDKFDLFSPHTELPMLDGWKVKKESSRASGREVQLHQDIPPDAKGNKTVGSSSSGDVNRGSQRRNVVQKDGNLATQPNDFLQFWKNYELDDAAVKAAMKRGELTTATSLEITSSLIAQDGKYNWNSVKKYFRRRKTVHVPSGRKVPNASKRKKVSTKPKAPSNSNVGKGSGGSGSAGTSDSNEDVYDSMPYKYGLKWTTDIHGTIYFVPRKIYPVKSKALANFAGDWYCETAFHTIGETWKIAITLTR